MKIKGIQLNLTKLEFDALELHLMSIGPYDLAKFSLEGVVQKIATIRSRLDIADKLLAKFPRREG